MFDGSGQYRFLKLAVAGFVAALASGCATTARGPVILGEGDEFGTHADLAVGVGVGGGWGGGFGGGPFFNPWGGPGFAGLGGGPWGFGGPWGWGGWGGWGIPPAVIVDRDRRDRYDGRKDYADRTPGGQSPGTYPGSGNGTTAPATPYPNANGYAANQTPGARSAYPNGYNGTRSNGYSGTYRGGSYPAYRSGYSGAYRGGGYSGYRGYSGGGYRGGYSGGYRGGGGYSGGRGGYGGGSRY